MGAGQVRPLLDDNHRSVRDQRTAHWKPGGLSGGGGGIWGRNGGKNREIRVFRGLSPPDSPCLFLVISVLKGARNVITGQTDIELKLWRRRCVPRGTH